MSVLNSIKETASHMTRGFLKKDFLKTVTGLISNPTPKSELFPYSYYENELFYTDSGTVGFIFEGEPVCGMDESFYKQLSLLFDDALPNESFLQTLLLASDDITPQLSLWRKARTQKSDILKRLEESKDAFYKDYNNNQERNFKHRNYRLLFVFSQKNGKKNAVLSFKDKLESIVNALKMEVRSLDAQELLELTGDIVSYGSRKKPLYNAKTLLSDALVDVSMSLRVTDKELLHGEDFISRLYEVLWETLKMRA